MALALSLLALDDYNYQNALLVAVYMSRASPGLYGKTLRRKRNGGSLREDRKLKMSSLRNVILILTVLILSFLILLQVYSFLLLLSQSS